MNRDVVPAIRFAAQYRNRWPSDPDVSDDLPGVAVALQNERVATRAPAPLSSKEIYDSLWSAVAIKIAECRDKSRGLIFI